MDTAVNTMSPGYGTWAWDPPPFFVNQPGCLLAVIFCFAQPLEALPSLGCPYFIVLHSFVHVPEM